MRFLVPATALAARVFVLSAAAILLLGVAACSSEPKSASPGQERDLRTEGRKVFGAPNASQSGAAGASADGGARWSILLATFAGEDAQARADAALAFVRTQMGMAEAHIEERKSGLALSYGRYSGPSDPRFPADLARIRAVSVEGRPIFAQAFLAPESVHDSPGSIPELDLSRVREYYGEDVQATLQVAVYESDKPGEARANAEQAALTLRSEGELAFYYHGPRRSMVTIGVFGAADMNPQTGYISPELEALRSRRPHNLFNGMGIRESHQAPKGVSPSDRAAYQRLQPSQLVQIP